MITWLDFARLPDVDRAIVGYLLGHGRSCRMSVRALDEAVGKCPRAVVSALGRLESAGYLTRDAGERVTSTMTLAPDATCAKIAARAPDCGQEYTGPATPVAWRDRMVWAYRTGGGLQAWREAGERLASGMGPDGLGDAARSAWEAAQ